MPHNLAMTALLIHLPDDKQNEDNDRENDQSDSVIVEVCHGTQHLGIVSVSFTDIRASNGERKEYPICITEDGVAADTNDDGKIKVSLYNSRAKDMFRQVTEILSLCMCSPCWHYDSARRHRMI